MVAVASGRRVTWAYTWLMLPAVAQMQRVLSATTVPTVLLGGDPSPEAGVTDRWAQAMAAPQVRGLVIVGQTLPYQTDGDVAAALLPRRRLAA
ncbi:MAG: hypothetical protein LC797_19125 [Chloroflexi bacterium]|nr:hypothetical protein [Chloroflexota bacterium]